MCGYEQHIKHSCMNHTTDHSNNYHGLLFSHVKRELKGEGEVKIVKTAVQKARTAARSSK